MNRHGRVPDLGLTAAVVKYHGGSMRDSSEYARGNNLRRCNLGGDCQQLFDRGQLFNQGSHFPQFHGDQFSFFSMDF